MLNKNKLNEEEDYDEGYVEDEEDEFDDYNEEYNDKYDEYDPSAVALDIKTKNSENKQNKNNSNSSTTRKNNQFYIETKYKMQSKLFFVSEIFNENYHYELLIKGFNSIGINLIPLKDYFDIIYRASCDGDNPKSFSELCGGSTKMLLIIKEKAYWKGRIFGCYCIFKAGKKKIVNNFSQNGFFFDVTNNKIIPLSISKRAFYDKENGPTLPGYFSLSSKYFSNENFYIELEDNKPSYFRCENVEAYLLKSK